MTINPPAAILLAMYIVVAEKQGVSKKEIGGTIQNDMLKEFIARKPSCSRRSHPFESLSIRLNTAPGKSPVGIRLASVVITSVRGRATAAQELAFTLADGIAYVEAAIERA